MKNLNKMTRAEQTELYDLITASVVKTFNKYGHRINHATLKRVVFYMDCYDICISHVIKQVVKYNAEKGEFEAWLNRVVHNKCLDFMRAQKNATVVVPITYDYDNAHTLWESKSREEFEAIELMLEAMENLCPRKRQILELRLQNLSYAEIAEIMNVSEKSVGTIINRAKRYLKRWMEGGNRAA
ncbi:MAG: sigma-70 family RNA polymerase sigma factor [Cryomorphaceae bacterium]|nr:MAG: sigma-70 family RNA polymerase sigma factor [Cryomorphaceae bacterium]